ncbi:MAG TPA: YbhB/YbcL family Raf kinase inhibitor-like protein [Gammaproteobacteria bacterium]|nr:YbhB/YbcL family Raf kinase inhibitor-like protein [Gammaproteobacteria bacterium]
MRMTIEGIDDNGPIPERFAFGAPDLQAHVRLSDNRNPGLAWADVPAGARSLVLLCVDPDVPSRPHDVNKEGRRISADLPRIDFYHWVLVDVAPAPGSIAEGACSDGITPGGKFRPPGPARSRQGINDYTSWFEGDNDMSGRYFGYDGPCPPWNDSVVHHYRFVLYATDLERCPVDGDFTGRDVMDAIDGHVLTEARVVGTYTLNPDL